MVRLLGRIAEKQILPTHETILRHGTKLLGTGNASTDSGTTAEILTGFESVKKAWFEPRMKKAPAFNVTLGVGPTPMLYQSDSPTISGGKLVVLYSSVGFGYVTVDWFAIGDI